MLAPAPASVGASQYVRAIVAMISRRAVCGEQERPIVQFDHPRGSGPQIFRRAADVDCGRIPTQRVRGSPDQIDTPHLGILAPLTVIDTPRERRTLARRHSRG